ncbi:uncharacterized protein LOC108154713 [Drosophila miranda]|uniref:uncharacterized protein LOC108154713 n=1 Tax=Drosophila miranda TaxID=7229 RepID=UPI0007E63553|nr:uncharacterized protein LOC108154713 [Drosophila miranda]
MECNIKALNIITIPVTPCSHSRLTTTESGVQSALHKLDTMDESVEGTVLSALLLVENKYRHIFENFKKEMELQAIAASTLWELIQRYRIAMEVDASSECTQLYDVEPKEEIIQKYYLHYNVIVSSNKSQWCVIQSLRSYVLACRRECKKLNLEEETPFIMGDAFYKLILLFIDLVDELFNYFLSMHLKLDCAASQLDPMDLESLEHYQKLLKPNEDFEEYFLYNLSYCQCLRMPPKCPETRVYTSIENAEMKNEAMEQQNAAPVTQDTEVPPNNVVPLMSGKLISVLLSAPVELHLVSERHTRELVHQVHSAISQS